MMELIGTLAAVLGVLGGFVAWLTSIARGIGRIESKLDAAHDDIGNHQTWLEEHDRRLRKVEGVQT
jgi:hypothetical protein